MNIVKYISTPPPIVKVASTGPQGLRGQNGTSNISFFPGIDLAGVKDGVNRDFALPLDAPFALIALRGRVLDPGFDYSRNGVAIQLVPGNEPFADDPFLAFLIGG